jgi:GAF domain-containing protein
MAVSTGQDNVIQSSARLSDVFAGLREQLGPLGLLVSVWNADGGLVDGFAPACEKCEHPCKKAVDGQLPAAQIAQRVLDTGVPVKGQSVDMGQFIGVPVHHRRHLVAVVVACYPNEAMFVGQNFIRLCKQLGLNDEAIAAQRAELFRYHIDRGDALVTVISAILSRENALQVAEDEIMGLSDNLISTYEELSLIYRLSGSIKVTRDPWQFIEEEVCRELLEVMDLQAVTALIYPHRADSEVLVFSAGEQLVLDEDEITAFVEDHLLPEFIDTPMGVVLNRFLPPQETPSLSAIERLVAIPLIGDDAPIGVLLAMNKAGAEFDSVDVKLLSAVANHATTFLVNHRLYSELQELLLGLLESLTASIDAKDPYTSGHSRRVARISEMLAERMGFDAARCRQIYIAGLLHDVGKIGIPEHILCKPDKLNDEEYRIVKQHPTVAGRILSGIRPLDGVLEGILTHHERIDGKGYPRGISGEAIPVEGRIIGLADCFDAMTSDRCYRKAIPLDEVIEEIRQHTGKQFDAEAVEAFMSLDLGIILADLRVETEQDKQWAQEEIA